MIEDVTRTQAVLVHRHLRTGWAVLFVSAALGLGVETLHAFKIAAYVAVSNETRRLMWTLAHAHGVGLGLINIAFASTVRLQPDAARRRAGVASRCLLASTALIPAGFFLGGCYTYDGDPGLGILLVPVGGLLLLTAPGLMVAPLWRRRAAAPASVRPEPNRSRRR